MDGPDSIGDDRTFKVDFTGDGAARLQDSVKEKLKEFMGDYTDDTLVEYVIVLLRNGRRKDEARRELNVFLGDDSVSFLSWLWDHLSLNLHLYVKQESFPDKVTRVNNMDELSERDGSKVDRVYGNAQTDSEYEREKTSKLSRSRQSREWKGLVHKANIFPLRSTVTEILHSERTEDLPNIGRRSRSPIPQVGKKRSRQDGQPAKRYVASYPIIDAPRRLLQFAVRDAVRTVQQSSNRTEPALKRLRSVISTSRPDSVPEGIPLRTRSVARVPGLSTALKVAAESAEDVTKVRYLGSVFNRLGHSMETVEPINQSSETRVPMLEDGDYGDLRQIPGSASVDYYDSIRYGGESTGDMTMLDHDDEITADSASDSGGYDNAGIVRHNGLDVSQSASSANKDRSLLKMQYTVAQDADEIVRKRRLIDQDSSINAAAETSSKIVNISVNVNTWKPPHYQEPRNINEVENQMYVDKNGATAGKQNVRVQKENDTIMAENENVIKCEDVEKESQKTVASTSGSYTASRPSEDPESRTVFVSNVHFAATKDTLSRHFNKFGEVLKVIIVTDAGTGQPTGSAYVEFLRKESTELALSLNGTSFMSRILKVVRRSTARHEAASMLGWPRIARASPFASRIPRMAFPRGALAGAFRARIPIKTGARSLQWKRGASISQTAKGTKGPQNGPLASGSSVSSPTGRNLTYVRNESKADGNPAVA